MGRRRQGQQRVEFGVKESFKKKLVRSRLKWARHVERMRDGKMAESRCPERGGKTEARKAEDCVKRDLERVGGEWRTAAKDRSWRLLIEAIVRER